MAVIFAKVDPLREIFSEFGLIKRRVAVEVAWLIALSECPEIEEVPCSRARPQRISPGIASNFETEQADRVKSIEATTNHDVKAVEYFLKELSRTRPNYRGSASSSTLDALARTSITCRMRSC